MRTSGVALLAFSVLGLMVAVYVAANIPGAYAEFTSEPEDLYLLLFWFAAAAGSAAIWFISGRRLLRREQVRGFRLSLLVLSFVFLVTVVWGVFAGVI